MPLTTVFFPGPSKAGFDYRKAIVEKADIKYFLDMGASLTPVDARIADIVLEPTKEAEKGDPNKGWGKPGSKEWLLNQIKTLKTSEEIAKVIKESINKKVDASKPVTIVRGIAKTLLKEHFDK